MIPKLIHLIWLGDDSAGLAAGAVEHWRQIGGGREVILHRDDSALLPEWRDAWKLATNPSMQSDLLRWSLLLTLGGWYFDCDVRTRLTLDEIESDCRLDGKKCFVTLFGSTFSPPASDILACGLDWPGRAAVIDYVRSQCNPARIHHWSFAGEMIGAILREHREWFTVAPPERYSMMTVPREQLVFLRGGQTEKGLVRHRRARSAKKPKSRTPLDAERRRGLIDSMRQSVVAIAPSADRAVTEQRLAKCKACDLLRFSGCGLPCSCNGRWGKWRERIIEGRCEPFSDIREPDTAISPGMAAR